MEVGAETQRRVEQVEAERDAARVLAARLAEALNGGAGAQPGALHANLTYFARQLENRELEN